MPRGSRAPTNELIREQLETGSRRFHAQLARQFALELDRLDPKPRRAVLAAADALTQIETLDVYRHQRRFSASETRELLLVALRALLTRKY